MPAGNLQVTANGGNLTTSATIDVKSGSVSSVVLLDGKGGGLTLRTLTDAAGATTMPIGAVPAGGGGTAPRPGGTDPTWAWGLGAAVLGLAGLVGLARRRAAA